MGVRVLLIEDDRTIAEPLVEGLGNFGLAVRHVGTGGEGLRGPYGDVVLLDLGLPDIDGIDVCRGIRQNSDVPIIILSARGEEADRVLGLELGADDYLAKPFSMRELVARVRAVTRRTHRGLAEREFTGQEPVGGESFAPAAAAPLASPTSGTTGAFGASEPFGATGAYEAFEAFEAVEGAATVTVPAAAPAAAPASVASAAGPLVVDRRTRQVWVGEEAVALTPKEFELLALLTEDPGAVYSRQQILDRVWDPHYQGPTKTLDVHVATLRRKLGNPAWIQTLRGVGFRLAVHTSSPTARQPYEPPDSAPPPTAPPAFARPAHPGPAHPGPAHPGPAHPGPAHPGPAHPRSAYGPSVHQPHAHDPHAHDPHAYDQHSAAYR